MRQGGFEAKERAVRLYDERGVDGLVTELEALGGDDVRRRYVMAVFDRGGLPASDTVTLLDAAGRLVKGDHALARILRTSSPGDLADEDIARAYLGTARSIASDYEQRRALEHVIDGPLSEASWNEFFTVAHDIDSDYEAAKLITNWAGLGRSQLPASLPKLLSQISGDYEQRKATQALFEGPLSREARDTLLMAAAKGISSDHEASELLRTHATHGHGTATDAAVELLKTINGGSEQLRAASALFESADKEQLPALVLATRLPNHERGRLVAAITERIPQAEASTELRDAIEQCAAGISSDDARRRALQAWDI